MRGGVRIEVSEKEARVLKPFARVAFNVVRRWRIHSVGRIASIVIYRLTPYPRKEEAECSWIFAYIYIKIKKNRASKRGLDDEIDPFLYFTKIYSLFYSDAFSFFYFHNSKSRDLSSKSECTINNIHSSFWIHTCFKFYKVI